LQHHFARLGVNIRQIGSPVEHRGTRVPSMMTVAGIVDGLNFVMRPLYEVVAAEVKQGVQAHREASLVTR